MASKYKLTDIKKLLEQDKLSVGSKVTLKALKRGELSTVFLCSNCDDKVKKDAERFTEISNVELVELKQPNDELGIVCKKPFAISVLGLLKA